MRGALGGALLGLPAGAGAEAGGADAGSEEEGSAMGGTSTGGASDPTWGALLPLAGAVEAPAMEESGTISQSF